MKRLLSLLLCLLVAGQCILAMAEAAPQPTEDDRPFIIRNGSRDEKRIALTMDDCYEIPRVQEALELCKQYGIVMTIFPLGQNLHEADAAMWQELIDNGCEIGCHSNKHYNMGYSVTNSIYYSLGHFQERLDQVLGYHYQVQSMRPPFGNITDENGSQTRVRNAIKRFGYPHVVNWDVSQTDPAKAIKDVKNGSILLYHARNKDVKCIATLIPQLLEQGYEFVTVSELLDFGPIQTSDELYVYSLDNYR